MTPTKPTKNRLRAPAAFRCAAFFIPALAAALLAASCAQLARVLPGPRYAYPPARKSDVVDDYFGTKVADPYRWLEDADSPETQKWVASQNELTEKFLADAPGRQQAKQRLTALLDYPRYSSPFKKSDRYFFYRNTGLQKQSVLYYQDDLDAEPNVVINPNLLSPDGTIALNSVAVSENANLLAYGLSQSGSDWQKIKVRDINTGRDFEDTLIHCRFTSIAWTHDNRGFFYDRYPDPNTVAPEDQANFNHLCYHTLGTPQSEDPVVFRDPNRKELSYSSSITEDGRYLILHVWHGTDPRNRVYYRPVESKEPFTRLLNKADASYTFLGNTDAVFYFRTDLDAPRGRIIAIDIDNPDPCNWREIIPRQTDTLDYAAIINNRLVVAWLHDVHHLLKIYDLRGNPLRDIHLPAPGTVTSLSGRQYDTEMFFGFTSFLHPTTTYRYDFNTRRLAVLHKPEIDFDFADYETRQVFYHSKDGTRVPMFITHKKGLKLNGQNPTLLYGYGGFNISLKPRFSVSRLVWLEHGGIYAVANLRGGSEYGENWHRAGMLDKKQNVFDDFIAAAEWLIENDYTRPDKLAIQGGSNGGLLVAACMLQRPDLYGAVICQVPVADMLRYHKFTVGRFWIPEFGSAQASPEQFDTLYAYSPLHNIEPGKDYPPVFVFSADTDDRVLPAHAKKFVASLQANSPGNNPIILHVETKAGHGAGKPLTKVINQQADIYAFLFKTLNVKSAERTPSQATIPPRCNAPRFTARAPAEWSHHRPHLSALHAAPVAHCRRVRTEGPTDGRITVTMSVP